MARGDSHQAERRAVSRHIYRRARLRRTVGSLVVVVGSAMAVAHLIAHLANMGVIGAQDLLIGFPMAVVLILVGVLLIGWNHHAE